VASLVTGQPVPVITPLNIGRLRGNLGDWYQLPPEHRYAGRTEAVAILCYHVAWLGRSVLVDAAAYTFSSENASMVLPGPHPPPLGEQLATAGADPGAITDVVITHAHFDHINGLTQLVEGRYVPAFPNARHYLGAGDWDPEHFEALENNTLAVVEQHGLLNLVRGPLELGEGLEIVPAPGETPGHQVLHLNASGVEAYFTGDLYHHPLEFEEPGRNVFWAEPEAMQASKAMIMQRAAASGALVYFAHIEGAWTLGGPNKKWAVRNGP
jgi:glyoxylase-like metal-dependent hydrolase (beta-lactamase superfamily II)